MLLRIKKLVQKILEHEGFMRYFANTSWVFAEQMLRLLAGLLVGVWVARYLGPERFGVFSYVVAFVAIFGSIAKLGLDAIIVRDLVNNPKNKEVYLGTAFWLKFVGAIFAIILIFLATFLTSNDYKTNLYILIVSSGLIFQSFEVVDFYFQSRVISKFVSFCKIIQLLFSSLLKLYLVLIGADLFWFFIVSLIDQIVLAITLFVVSHKKHIRFFYNQFDKMIAIKQLKDSWPMIFSGLVVMVYMRIDQIMIKSMMGDKAVGIYSAAVRLSEIWYFIPMVITSSLLPAILNSKHTSEQLYYDRLQKFYAFLVWLAIAIALLMTLLSDWLILILYGEAYKQAGQVLIINSWSGIFVFLGVAGGSWFTSENLQLNAFYQTFTGMVINVLLNLALIPFYGLIGAAIASLISYMIAGFLSDYFYKKTKILFFIKLNAFSFKFYKYFL